MLELLQSLLVSDIIRRSTWLFPAIQIVHLAGIALVFGTITLVDLTLLGMIRSPALETAASPILTATQCGIAIVVISGALLFVSDPLEFWSNPAFRLKLLAFSLAIANALVFQRYLGKPTKAASLNVFGKLSLWMSLMLWTSILILGRAVAYV